MNYGSQFNRQQQAQQWNTPQPTPPPQKSSRKWIWIVLIVALAGIVSAMGYFAWKAGTRIGNEMNKGIAAGMRMMDSMGTNTHEEQFQRVFALLGNDSASLSIRTKLEALQQSADSVIAVVDQYESGFRDTLQRSGSSAFDKRCAHHYFILSGRAAALKKQLWSFRNSAFTNLPADQQDSSMLYQLMIDDVPKQMPQFMKNMMQWDKMTFDQPPMNIRANLRTLRMEIRLYEGAILDRWETIIRNLPPASKDSSGVIVI